MKYSKIIKKTKIESEPVYHITVEENHNFFANKHCVHNCQFRGEIKVILHNTSNVMFKVEKGMRIAQMVINKLPLIEYIEVDKLSDTTRGKNGFGSTGVK